MNVLGAFHEFLEVASIGILNIPTFASELSHGHDTVRRKVLKHMALSNEDERSPVDLLLCPRNCEMISERVAPTEFLYGAARERVRFT